MWPQRRLWTWGIRKKGTFGGSHAFNKGKEVLINRHLALDCSFVCSVFIIAVCVWLFDTVSHSIAQVVLDVTIQPRLTSSLWQFPCPCLLSVEITDISHRRFYDFCKICKRDITDLTRLLHKSSESNQYAFITFFPSRW